MMQATYLTDPNAPAEPIEYHSNGTISTYGGLTKREHFALEMLKVMIRTDHTDTPVKDSVEYADALIRKLNGV